MARMLQMFKGRCIERLRAESENQRRPFASPQLKSWKNIAQRSDRGRAVQYLGHNVIPRREFSMTGRPQPRLRLQSDEGSVHVASGVTPAWPPGTKPPAPANSMVVSDLR